MEHVLSRCRKRGDRTSVKAILECDDRRFSAELGLAVLSCRLDRALVGFRARVREEDLLHSRAHTKLLRKASAGLAVIKIRGVLDLSELLGDRRDPLVIGNTKAVDGNTRAEVNIFVSFVVPDVRALSLDKAKVKARIGRRDVLFVKFFNVHNHSPIRTSFRYPRRSAFQRESSAEYVRQ